MLKNRFKKGIISFFGIALVITASFIIKMVLESRNYKNSDIPLKIMWEGAYLDYNFRDVGRSFNSCLGKEVFKTDLLFRANGWFSGWSCNHIGNPDAIYSLNFDPEIPLRSYCRANGTNMVGKSFNPNDRLSNLEFVQTWDDPETNTAICQFLTATLTDLANGKKVLVHCDAGKDRTGALSALLGAIIAEDAGILDSTMIDALECDYEKSKNLEHEKYGRIRAFITHLQDASGPSQFVHRHCQIDTQLLKQAARHLLAP